MLLIRCNLLALLLIVWLAVPKVDAQRGRGGSSWSRGSGRDRGDRDRGDSGRDRGDRGGGRGKNRWNQDCSTLSGKDKTRCEQKEACRKLEGEERKVCQRQARCSRYDGQEMIDCMQRPSCSDLEDPDEEASCRAERQCGGLEGSEKSRCMSVARINCRELTDETEIRDCRKKKLCGHLLGTEKDDCESEAGARCDNVEDEAEKEACYETRRARRADRFKMRNLNFKLEKQADYERRKSERVSVPRNKPEVAQHDPNSKPQHSEMTVNAKTGEESELFGGDMSLTNTQAQQIADDVPVGRRKRKVGKSPQFQLWNKLPISYGFDSSISNAYRPLIRDAIKLWQDNTCIRYEENGPDVDRLEFYKGGGCSSYVGRTGGTQEISIAIPGCNYLGIVSHEIGHSLGFMHEQARPDQSQFVKIAYSNISPSRWNNFLPAQAKEVNDYGYSYDYGSVMHYDAWGFAINSNLPSIETVDPFYQQTIGQRNGPSFIDFAQVNAAYCNDVCPRKLSCQHGGYTDPNDCNKCKCPTGFGGTLCETLGYSTCGGELEAFANPNYITSPGYPGYYGSNQECIWRITTQAGSKISLTFEDTFEFDCKDSCDDGHVELKKGDDWRRTGYRFCCSKRPTDTFVSESNEMILIFRNIDGARKRGFKAKFTANVPTTGTNTGVTPPTTTQPPYTTTTPVPPGGTTTPTNPAGCSCGSWSAWSGACSSECGGCGDRTRTRNCNGGDKCLSTEKTKCNLNVCPDEGLPFKIDSSGNLKIIFKGCCVGLFNMGGQCAGLDGLSSFFGGGSTGGSGGGSSGGGGLPIPSFGGGGNGGAGSFLNTFQSLLGGGGSGGGGNPLGSLTNLFGAANPVKPIPVAPASNPIVSGITSRFGNFGNFGSFANLFKSGKK